MSDEQMPSDWAIEKALEPTLPTVESQNLSSWSLAEIKRGYSMNLAYCTSVIAFARYIETHEEEPVDPLLIEARQLVETTVHWSPQTDRDLQAGKNDKSPEVKIALAALRRGMALATQPTDQVQP